MRRAAYWATVGFMFTVPWEAAIRVGGLGRVSRVVGLVAAGLWVLSVLVHGRTRPPSAFIKAYFAVIVWNGFSLFWTIDLGATLKGFLTYAQIFGMMLVVWDLFGTEQKIQRGLQAFVLGAYVSCISIFVNWATAPPTKYPEHQRIKALGFEVDGIALIIALAIPIAWNLAIGPAADRQRSRILTFLNFAMLPAGFFAVTLTGTRGAAVASVPTVAFVVWTLRNGPRPERRHIAAAMLGVSILGLVLFAPREPLQRIGGTVGDVAGEDSLSGRRDIWREGIDRFMDHPFTGVGLDAHRAAVSAGKEAHNTGLSILIESGVVGIVLMTFVIVAIVGSVMRMDRWNARYWTCQLSAIAFGSVSLSLEDSKSVWILASLAVATAAVRRDETGVTAADDAALALPAGAYAVPLRDVEPT